MAAFERVAGTLTPHSTAHLLLLRVYLPATLACATLLCVIVLYHCRFLLALACVFCTFLTAHGISMVIGRRRPRLHHTQSTLSTQSTQNTPALQLIHDWSTQPNVQVLNVLSTNDIQWGAYSRASPQHVPTVWQVLLTYWNLLFALVVRLPFRRAWDAGGLDEALLRCPYESFFYPTYHLFGGSTCHNVREKEAVPRVYKMATTKGNAWCVGYRGVVFNATCMGYDRQTSIASLHELMAWSSDPRYAKERTTDRVVVAAQSLQSFGFPVGLQRSGRHPRHLVGPSTATAGTEQKRTGRPTTVHVQTLVSVLQLHNGYYHWVTERLPALCLVLPLLQSNPEAKLLVDLSFHRSSSSFSSANNDNNPWCHEYLEMLQIPRSRVIQYDPTTVYTCDTLYITSPLSPYSTHRGLLQLVRRTLLPSINSISARTATRTTCHRAICASIVQGKKVMLLIDRVGSRVRRTSIWNALRQQLLLQWQNNPAGRRWDIHVVALHQMPVVEQMHAFQHADLVVGVHGAGLSNVVWCRSKENSKDGSSVSGGGEGTEKNIGKGTKLLEIVTINPPQIRHLFWHLATSIGVDYYPFHVMSSWNDALVEIDVNRLIARIEVVLEINGASEEE